MTGINVSVKSVLHNFSDKGWTELVWSGQGDTLVLGVVSNYIRSESLLCELSAAVKQAAHTLRSSDTSPGH